MSGAKNGIDRTGALPLEGLPVLSSRQIQTLKGRWISTIESFVGAASTLAGPEGFCKALDISFEELNELLRAARDSLGEERYDQLMTPKPGGPIGALMDDCWRSSVDGSTGEEEP